MTTGVRKDGFRMPEGRTFEKVPRVLACHNDNEAVVLFHGADAPHGGPRATFEQWKTAPREQKLIRLYGVAEKQVSNRFPRFDAKVHVIPDDKIPTAGANYLFGDPASSRNFFWTWVRITRTAKYVYREWPGSYAIPGVGHPGPWAENDAKRLDGARGPAARAFGFTLLDYKREIARLEGWPDATRPGPDGKLKPVELWTPAGAVELITERFLDARAASSPRVQECQATTLVDDFDRLGLYFNTVAGGLRTDDDQDFGVQGITNDLAWDAERPMDYLNQPRLFVAASCMNTIYALENWTGDDGQAGACKDPIDNLRYVYVAGVGYAETAPGRRGGGYC